MVEKCICINITFCSFLKKCPTKIVAGNHTSKGDKQSVGSSVPVVNRRFGPGNRTLLEVTRMVAPWWIVAFSCS